MCLCDVREGAGGRCAEVAYSLKICSMQHMCIAHTWMEGAMHINAIQLEVQQHLVAVGLLCHLHSADLRVASTSTETNTNKHTGTNIHTHAHIHAHTHNSTGSATSGCSWRPPPTAQVANQLHSCRASQSDPP